MNNQERMLERMNHEHLKDIEQMRREVNECHDLEENQPARAAELRRKARIEQSRSF